MNGYWLLVAGALALTACAPPPGDGARFDFGVPNSSIILDPRFATDAHSARIARLLYRAPVDFDDQFRPVPELMTWQVIAPRHYRFVVRRPPGRFHDGTAITARDVAATYRSILAPDSGSPHRGPLSHVTRVLVVDDQTVDFHLSQADPLFPGRLVHGILPASELGGTTTRFTGSGPFEYLAGASGGVLRLRRRSDGFEIAFHQVSDPAVRVLKLIRGELDLIQNDLSPELMTYAAGRPGVRLLRRPGSNFAYLGFNLADPVTGRVAFRQAVAHAVDRDGIIEQLWRGFARPAQSVLAPEHWAAHPALTPYPYAPERARRLLQDAFPGQQRIAVSYKVSTDPLRLRVATIVQHQLARVGIDLTVQSHDWGAFYADVKAGRFQMYSLAWVGIKMPDIFRYLFHSSSLPPAGANRGRFQDSAIDRLIEAAEARPVAADAAAWRDLQARLHQMLPYVPLWYEDQVALMRADWAGYELTADGNYDALARVRHDR